MARKKILFICGSLNQTTMMHKISQHLAEYDHAFTPFYCDGFYKFLEAAGLLDFTIVAGQHRRTTEKYLAEQDLRVDYGGVAGDYDLVVTCTDLLVQRNILDKKVVLVQEGMTDPEGIAYHIVRRIHKLGVPRWLASTSTTGLSDRYERFCVASEGYRKHFIRKGVKAEKVVVTGIPNFDNVREYLKNDFPHQDYVLVATTDTRENFKWDNRRSFLKRAKEIAGPRPIIFKLHPNENAGRSTREIKDCVPGALVFSTGNTNHMIANCHTLVTQFSSVVYLGLALGKKVYSYFDLNQLQELVPVQNGGVSAENIARVCREYL
jgi:hypothetical protein